MRTEPKVYFDASVFVAAFLDEATSEVARAALTDAERDDTSGYFSGLAMAEVLGAPSVRAPQGPPDPELPARLVRIADYFKASRFTYVEDSLLAGERAMDLAVRFGIRGPDALHLALAEMAGCDYLFSFDDDHLAVGGQLAPLRVCKPFGAPQAEFELDGSEEGEPASPSAAPEGSR